MKRNSMIPAVVACVALAATLVSCSGTADESSPDAGDYVSGGTFVKSSPNDPGNLNPFHAVQPPTWDFVSLVYETLIYVTPDGELLPWLAEKWEESGTEVTFTLRDGITCEDGTDFTGQTVADNINYNADPENATFSYGSAIDEQVSATAEGNVVTVTSETTNPFLGINIGMIRMVCDAGLNDPSILESDTNSTGLFTLTDVKPGDTYTLTKRDDYTWGPEGVTSDTEGLPDTIEFTVIEDESTAANLLLSGEINAAAILGADRARLDGAGLSFVGVRNPIGEMLFNERDDRVFSDPLVREALVTAIDRDEVGAVITDGAPMEPVSLVVRSPLLCVEDEPEWALPETDLEYAADLLDQAGWILNEDGKREKDGEQLVVKFVYNAATAVHAPAAELVQQTWNELGVTTELFANDAAAWSDQLYSSFDWDTGWIQIPAAGPVALSKNFAGATPDQGGLNFMFADNPEYNELAKQAQTAESSEAACEIWRDAEKELIERFDVFPVMDTIRPTYQSGAVFEQPNYVQPTTIRMTR